MDMCTFSSSKHTWWIWLETQFSVTEYKLETQTEQFLAWHVYEKETNLKEKVSLSLR